MSFDTEKGKGMQVRVKGKGCEDGNLNNYQQRWQNYWMHGLENCVLWRKGRRKRSPKVWTWKTEEYLDS